jgi:hypothetical protein
LPVAEDLPNPLTSTPRSPAAPAGQPALAGAAAAVAQAAADPEPGDKLPPLMDAQQRVDALMARIGQEPAGVLAGLEDLDRSYAKHPLVLQALSICHARSGDFEAGLRRAREALPLCFERGHSYLAAGIFKEFRAHIDALELSRDQVLVIGQALQKTDDLAGAAKAFTTVIAIDPGDVRAIKGLLQVADDILHAKHKPEAAAKVYRYLVDHCSSSPLAEFMRRGLEECERQTVTA